MVDVVDWLKNGQCTSEGREKKVPTPPILEAELIEGSNDAIRVEIARSSSTL